MNRNLQKALLFFHDCVLHNGNHDTPPPPIRWHKKTQNYIIQAKTFSWSWPARIRKTVSVGAQDTRANAFVYALIAKKGQHSSEIKHGF